MTIRRFLLFAAAGTLALASQQSLAFESALYDWGFNIDGTTYCLLGPCDNDGLNPATDLPASINASAFNFATGLGSLGISISGAGSHSVIVFFDHELDESTSGFYNELGGTGGVAPAGLSWEIDEPGYGGGTGTGGTQYFGDIFTNFGAAALDNLVLYDAVDGQFGVAPEDISMARGYGFTLAAGETFEATVKVSDTLPSGFYLYQTDPAITGIKPEAKIYLSATSRISGGPAPAPAPATLALMAAGLFCLRRFARRGAV
jgi:hypothetical protein